MLVDFGKAGFIEKARQQPDKVRMVLDKIRTDGLVPTIEAVRNKLDQPMPMGYSNVGVVVAVGEGVAGFAVGDRVVSNGRHAEVVAVPVNLCARIPEGVEDESASFTVLASIGLQGIRLVRPTLGEAVVVTGLGLIGILTVQLLRSSGCRVLGLDFDKSKLALARSLGAEVVDLSDGIDPVLVAQEFSRGRGVDAVIITAATRSNEPVHQAALMCRKRGRIVLVGVTGLELSRADFYEKELTFQVSCSYGPGRYDPSYEQGGNDYPVGFVRWTEQRNFEATLDMLADGRLSTAGLITHRFEIDKADEAYDVVGGKEPSLGILLCYPADERQESRLSRTVSLVHGERRAGGNPGVGVSVIGAGGYAGAVLIPAFKEGGANFRYIAGSGGPGSVHLGRKHGFAKATTNIEELLSDRDTANLVIATRHDSHARYVVSGLDAGKNVFVEKPLCITLQELQHIRSAVERRPGALLMVGFNRRFAPHVVRIKQLLKATPGPKALIMTVNAGAIPASHWTQDSGVGGGRIVGEGCHFLDLLRHLAGEPIESLHAEKMSGAVPDSVAIQVRFADGSVGTIHYLANGAKAFPKERLEVFAGGGILQLDNFRRLRGFGWKGFTSMNIWRQDKGQQACAAAFLRAVEAGAPSPIPPGELFEVAEWSIRAQELVR